MGERSRIRPVGFRRVFRMSPGWLMPVAALWLGCGDDATAPDDGGNPPDDGTGEVVEDGALDADAEVEDAAGPDDASDDADDGGGPPEVAVGLTSDGFTFDGIETFVLAASYYGGCAAPEERVRADLEGLAALGFNNVRVWVAWSVPTAEASVVRNDGTLEPGALARLRRLLELARGLGMTVDLTFAFGLEGLTDGGFDAYRAAMVALTAELGAYRNAWFDLGNERDVGDARFLSVEQVRDLALAVRAADADRLVTASGGGSSGEQAAVSWDELYRVADLDFATPHFSRDDAWAAETEARVTAMRAGLLAAGWERPIYLQEEARRGYAGAEWPKEMFLTAVAGARRAGAAGWCFHTDAGFDLVAASFFDQLDDVERDLLDELAAAAAP
jgi:hypothetical protein